jgi:hypothetical protein
MTTMTTMTAPGKGTLIMEVVAKASGLIRGERQSGVGVVISHTLDGRTPQRGMSQEHLPRQRWQAKTDTYSHRVSRISLTQSSASGEDAVRIACCRHCSLQHASAATESTAKRNTPWTSGRHDPTPHRTTTAGHRGGGIPATTWLCTYDLERAPNESHSEEKRKGGVSG